MTDSNHQFARDLDDDMPKRLLATDLTKPAGAHIIRPHVMVTCQRHRSTHLQSTTCVEPRAEAMPRED